MNGVDTFYLRLLIPINKKDDYLKRIKKIASAPNEIEDEYLNFLSEAMLKQDCQYALEEIKNLSIKEKMFLEQMRFFKEEALVGNEWSATLNEIMNLRQSAGNFTRNLDIIEKSSLNKFEVNLTIQNFPG